MSAFLHERLKSFGPAFSGWWRALRSQPNTWLHAVITVVVFLLGWWLGLARIEWVAILIATMVVWAAEFFNTALEAVVDLASPEHHELAKTAKDVSAAAVLISAIGAVLVGLLLLGPPLLARLSGLL
jgi:diacylglycerol kinase (ATP)